jgi:hypothetical protein
MVPGTDRGLAQGEERMARPRQDEIDGANDRYEATSVDDLCRASGLSKSSVYSGFWLKSNEKFMHLAKPRRVSANWK